MAANVTTLAPSPGTDGGVPGLISPHNASDALLGLCGWTSEDAVCYVTVLPIALCLVVLIGVLARQLAITPQHSALQATIQPKESPLLPPSFRYFEAGELNQTISGVSDMPLKTFLPRVGLAELVEPSAALGIANVKDLLRANRLALRDIGIGPRETRLFSRALERRVRLREKMQDVFLSTSTRFQARDRAPTLTQRSREAVARSLRARRAAAASESGMPPPVTTTGSDTPRGGAAATGSGSTTPTAGGAENMTPFGIFTNSFEGPPDAAATAAGGSFGAWSGKRGSLVPPTPRSSDLPSRTPGQTPATPSAAPPPLQQYGGMLTVTTPGATPRQAPAAAAAAGRSPPVQAAANTTSKPSRPPQGPADAADAAATNESFSRDRQDTLPPFALPASATAEEEGGGGDEAAPPSS